MASYGEAGKDMVRYGSGKPDKGLSRRGFLKAGAAGTVAVGVGGVFLKFLEGRISEEKSKEWQRIVGGQENPHPELGHLIWRAAFTVKPGAEFNLYPTNRTTPPEFPFTTPLEGNPVIHKMGDTVMRVYDALLFAQEPLPGEKDIAVVKPIEGESYNIGLESIRFAVDLPQSPTGVGWLSLDDVRFLNDSNQVLETPPLDRIIQAPISGDTPWKGMADIAGTPLHVGLVSR